MKEINWNATNTSIPIIIARDSDFDTTYSCIGNGDEGSIYNYKNKYALKKFSLFRTMEYFYGDRLKRKFMKVEAMRSLKDEAFCYPIGFLQSDEVTKEGCYSDLVFYDASIKDFNYLRSLRDTKKVLDYILKADAAIQRAHKNEIVIGDIKESNIMINMDHNIKFVDTDNYAYQDFDFDLIPERSRCLSSIYNHPVSMIDNDIYVFSIMALIFLTKDESFNCFYVTKENYNYLIDRLNVSQEVNDGLKIIFSDAQDKPYIGPILQKIDYEKTLLIK